MMKFSALNESSLSDDNGDPELASREAQEEEAYSSYHLALKNKAQPNEDSNDEAPFTPCFNPEALEIDNTDVFMWYQMGKAAINILNFSLARLAFEEGLKCNPSHWPCLDNIITVMYTLNDYANCLYYIAKALERECYYLKGLVFKDEIYREDPSLKSFCEEYFNKCDPSIHSAEYDKEEAQKLIQEALDMRIKRQSFHKPTPLPVLSLTKPIRENSSNSAASPHVGLPTHKSEGLLQLATLPPEDYRSRRSSVMEIDEMPTTPTTPNVNANPYTLDIKRKRLLSELNDLSTKRRSSRVRNPAIKKPQDNINYQELLQKFLPPKLIGDGKCEEPDEDSEPTSLDKTSRDFSCGQSSENDKSDKTSSNTCDLTWSEKEEVCQFIANNLFNAGIIDLLYKYVVILGKKSTCIWPKSVVDVFCNAFARFRHHIATPNLFCNSSDGDRIKEVGLAILSYCEFKVDKWYLSTGHSMSFSPKGSTGTSFQHSNNGIGNNFHSDMEFLVMLTVRSDILGSDWLEFSARALWLKAKFHSLEGEIDLAICCMEKLSDVLYEENDIKITVQNSSFSNIITADKVQQQLESLQRCQSLEEVQRLYEHGDYTAVVNLLILTFNQPSRTKRKQPLEGVPERHAQLLFLQNSLLKLERYKFMNAARSDWSETMAHLLNGLDRCVKLNTKYLKDLDDSKLVRLTQNLILVIVIQMENYDFSSDNASLLIVLPWIILYHLILKRSWCTAADGLLLFHIIDVCMAELQDSTGKSYLYKEELETGLEQCIYCLYGHPHKRTRAKHLQEHNARQITLTWEKHFLQKKIQLLEVDNYTAYIEGVTEKFPEAPFKDKPVSELVKDLYYLLGDYYFKNKEFSKAIRFYLMDICINPDRQDSWAGMALSRSSQLDQKLNSYELRNESTIYRKSAAALKQLKQDTVCEELMELLIKKKQEMLQVAEKCFRSANHCDDGGEPEEAWLHHYMLGKISEKKGEGPAVYMDHYQKALMYLHEDFARYPQKIQYHNPLELSIEALEVYYRVHASCLKFLWKHEDVGVDLKTLKIIKKCLFAISKSPFAHFQEKCREKSSSSSALSEVEDYALMNQKKRQNRPSIDSSPETQDNVALQEVMDSLVGAVAERFVDEELEKANAEINTSTNSSKDTGVVIESVAEEVYTSKYISTESNTSKSNNLLERKSLEPKDLKQEIEEAVLKIQEVNSGMANNYENRTFASNEQNVIIEEKNELTNQQKLALELEAEAAASILVEEMRLESDALGNVDYSNYDMYSMKHDDYNTSLYYNEPMEYADQSEQIDHQLVENNKIVLEEDIFTTVSDLLDKVISSSEVEMVKEVIEPKSCVEASEDVKSEVTDTTECLDVEMINGSKEELHIIKNVQSNESVLEEKGDAVSTDDASELDNELPKSDTLISDQNEAKI
ncbi:calcineurin-binding protein cabin-1 [Caerostris extrusa]|uniref:Calcineurin-binding protein cabin-1 n=1 Tax=Caerostris extrusa TaxID=172846 RepID=A0AAV4SZD5_CAEEX|nr:calcineurin-binding protein cabin-1 [Caerostris extrusa]